MVQECQTGVHRAPPELWPQLGEEFRCPYSAVVSAGVADTTGVRWRSGFRSGIRWRGEFHCCGGGDGAVVPGHAQTPHWVGKRFRDHFLAAPFLKA
jgi:hypothetical protein